MVPHRAERNRGSAAADFAYAAVVVIAVFGWVAVIASGVMTLARGGIAGRSLGIAAFSAGTLALVIAVVLLALSGTGRFGDEALDDVLLQTWPTFVLCLFAGDWARRPRQASRGVGV